MDDNTKTPVETPNPLKSPAKTTEFWTTLATTLTSFVIAFNPKHATVITTVIALLAVAIPACVYAYGQTTLPSSRPGWKTKSFWTAVITIVGTVSLAVSETDIPGLPPGVTRLAALVAAGIATAGYSLLRFKAKRDGTA